ncbi:hypothetical protein GW17_00031982 [Ensete ventricosum]|nr:hypothetical protein GW17_00031982 [Ensete ventricosum]
MEVLSPGIKTVQNYLVNRMLVYVYREFRAKEKPGILPHIRADELFAQFPGLTDAFVRKRLKHCADIKKGSNGQLLWARKVDFRIPSEEELRRILSPENVSYLCSSLFDCILLWLYGPRFAVLVRTSISRFGRYGTVCRAVRVPVNHRTGTYRPYRAVQAGTENLGMVIALSWIYASEGFHYS